HLAPLPDATAVFVGVNKLLYGKAQLNFINTGFVDMSGCGYKFGSRALANTDFGVFVTAHVEDVRYGSNRLYIVHHRGATVESHHSREGRLVPRVPTFSFKGFYLRGFLAADVSARSRMYIHLQ